MQSVFQVWACLDNFTFCHTETEIPIKLAYLLIHSVLILEPASPSIDPVARSASQGSHWSAKFEVANKSQQGKARSKLAAPVFVADALPPGHLGS